MENNFIKNETITIKKQGLTPFIDVIVCPNCNGKKGVDIYDTFCQDCGIKIIWE